MQNSVACEQGAELEQRIREKRQSQGAFFYPVVFIYLSLGSPNFYSYRLKMFYKKGLWPPKEQIDDNLDSFL